MSRIVLPKSASDKSWSPVGNGPLLIGEMLVKENLITTDQLNEAIEAQYLYGSRLGTSLLELGFIDEETLAQTLSQKLILPYIEPDQLMDIPEAILSVVTAELATKYLVVPCELDGKKLYLAMADPTNLMAIDELSFQLSLRVIPVVVPELRLMLALHKFYQLRLSPRVQILSKHMLNLKAKKNRKKSSPWQECENLRAQTPEEKSYSRLCDVEVEKLDNLSETANNKDFTPDFPVQLNKQTAKASLKKEKVLNRIDFSECCNLLAEVRKRDDLAQIVLNYVGQSLPAAALLMVKTGQIVGWQAVANRVQVANFNQLSLPLDQESTLRKVVESRRYYLGPSTCTEQDMELLKRLSFRPQCMMLLVPLIIKNRLIGLLYLQDQKSVLSERIDETHQLASKISMALEILILRGKIRSG